MKRKIAIYFVLIATLLGAVPYLTGMLVEHKFYDVVNLIGQVDSLPASVNVISYQRGWRKSVAQTEVVFYSDSNNTNKQYRLILRHDIRHGPFVQLQEGNYREWEFARALVHSSLLVTQEAEKILLAEIGQTNLFSIESKFDINGAVKIVLMGPQLKLKEHEGTDRVAFKGLKGVWNISADMQQIDGQMLLPGMDIEFNGVRLFLSNLYYNTQLKASAQGLWPGEFNVNAEKLSLAIASSDINIIVDGFNSRGVVGVQGQYADLIGLCHIQQLSLNDKVYGPIEYSNTLKHIDAQAFKSFLSLNHQIKTGHQEAKAKLFKYFISVLPELLKGRPEYTIDRFSIHGPAGDFNAQLYVAIGGLEAYNISNFPQILQSIVAKAAFVIPKSMLKDILTVQYQQKNAQGAIPSEQAPSAEQQALQTIAKWLQENMLVEKDQYYLMNVEVKEGKFAINGQFTQMPLPGQAR